MLRYWEEELELKIPRNDLGHRYYRDEEIQLLYCIKELKNKGFQLKAVKEVLPDLEEKKMIDVHKLLVAQVELENMEAGKEKEKEEYYEKRGKEGLCTEEDDEMLSEGPEDYDHKSNKVVSLRKGEDRKKVHAMQVPAEKEQMSIRNNEEKMMEFESIMGRIIGRALCDQAENLGDIMGDRICNKVIREIDDVLEEREEREEARFKKLDETIRSHQKARQEIAVTREEGGKKKSLFFRKNKRKI